MENACMENNVLMWLIKKILKVPPQHFNKLKKAFFKKKKKNELMILKQKKKLFKKKKKKLKNSLLFLSFSCDPNTKKKLARQMLP